MVLSAKGEMYKKEVREAWQDQKGQKLSGPVWLSAVLVQPDRRRRDLDNFCGKALLDALKGLAYDDDSQVWRLHAEWARHLDGSIALKKLGELSLAVRSMAGASIALAKIPVLSA